MQREDEADHGNGPGTNSSESAVNHLSKSVVRDTEGAAKQKPHATFCGNRGWATAPGDPVGAMNDKSYQTDLTDEQWRLISAFFTKSEKRGRERRHDLCRIIDGCFYVLRGGIPWRMMPHDLPPWRVVNDHFNAWRRNGKWERINQAL